MANRFPLVFDATANKRIEEIPTGDNLNLSGSSIVDAIDISATGTLTVPTISTTNITIGGNAIAQVAKTNSYNDLSNLPNLFSGDYNDLTNKPPAGTDWANITGKPVIATNLSQLINDTNFVTNTQISILPNQVTGLAAIATSGSFSDLSGVPNYVTNEQIVGGTLTVEVSNTGDLQGSVFADDSTLMVDHINNELLSNKLKTNIIEADDISILAPNGIFIETAQFLTLRTQSFEITNDNAGTTIEDQDRIRFAGNIDFANATVTGLVGQSIVGDIKGSVFADDSSLLVDAINSAITADTIDANTITATTLKGNIQKNGSALDISSDSGIQLLSNGILNAPNATTVTVAASQGVSITATNDLVLTSTSGTVDFTNSAAVDFTGVTVTGLTVGLEGDLQGSVFADNSTLLVDGVNGTIPAGNITGTFTGIDSPSLTTSTNLTITAGLAANITATNAVTLKSTSNGIVSVGNEGLGNLVLGSGNNTTQVTAGGTLDISDLAAINFQNSVIQNLEGGSIGYTPAVTGHWNGAVPTTVQEAIDRIVAAMSADGNFTTLP
jgi:hypothetical protein